MVRSLGKYLTYFWNKYWNCHSQQFVVPNLPFWYSWVILISKSENCATNELARKVNILWRKKVLGKKWLIISLRTSLNKVQLSRFFYSHWLLSEDFFSFLIKAFVKSEKLIRFHHQASITATDFGACAPHPLNFEQQNFFLQFLLITSWVTSVLKM